MSDEPTFDEVLEAAEALDELPDLARQDAWVSSVLGVWAEDPAAAEIDRHFEDWLASCDHPRGPALARAVHRVTHPLDGNVAATRAWLVRERDTLSWGIAFVASDGSTHSLLADVVDGELAALIVAPGPDELFDGAEDIVAPEPCDIADAASSIVDAWDTLVARRRRPGDDVWVNGALARARLRFLVEGSVDGFARPAEVDEAGGGIDATERAELDAWALSVLDGAGAGPGVPGDPLLEAPLRPEIVVSYPGAEREAFEALEWADWLGVVLGLVRCPVGEVVEPSMLVDLINRSPEVTSTIPRKDRPYYEWAWSMVLPLWRQAGVVDQDSRLVEGGADQLVAALRTAWAPSDA